MRINDFKADLWQDWYLMIFFIVISKQRKINLRCRLSVLQPDYKKTELIQIDPLSFTTKISKYHNNQETKE